MKHALAETRQFMRFVLVGVLNTAFGYGAYGFLLWLGVVLPLSLLGATVLGVLFNFVTTGRLVFRDFSWKRLPRFVLAYALVWALGTVVIAWVARQGPHAWLGARMDFLRHWFRGWAPLAIEQFTAGVLVMPFSTVLTYLLLRYFVHARPGGQPSSTVRD